MIGRLALLSLLCGVAAAVPARAQVQVDPGALDRLSPSAPAVAPGPAPAKPAPRRPARLARRPAPAHHPAPQTASKPAAPPAPPAAAVTIPPAPPPAAALAPPPALPPPRPLPPPVIPMVDGAAGDVSAIPGGLRITFGAGKSDMSPATVAALNKLGEAVAPSETAALNIYAYAAGAPDDPSTPRRLSLSRALAARAVLMSDNIASTRIYVHAMGGTPSPGPADRVDVQLAGNPSPPKDAAAK